MYLNGEEVFFVDIENDSENILVYAPLRSYLAIVKKSFKDILLNSPELKEQFAHHLEKKDYIDPHLLHAKSVDILPQLSIPITDGCNLKCEYCYFRAGDDDKLTVQSKYELASYVDAYFKKIKDYHCKQKSNFVDIAIAGGGEPTSQFDTMKYVVELIEEKGNQLGYIPRFNMPTNGFFGDVVREFIVNHFYQVSLSFDGPEDIQDYQRPTKNGGKSFKTVYETAKYFYNSNLSFAFRATITDYSLNRIPEILDFFNREFPGKTIGFEAMNLYGRAIGNNKVAPPDPEVFSNKLLEAYEYAYANGISVKTAGVGKYDQLRTVFCGSVGIPNWTVTTDGRITSCTRDNLPEIFSFGYYDKETKTLKLDEAKLKQVRSLNIFNYPECQDCFCKYNCAGDCPDLRMSNMINCDATRKVAAFVLLNKISKKE